MDHDFDPATFAGGGRLPPWADLPDDVKLELAALERWALTLDGAPNRCAGRECRKSGMCLADLKGPQHFCRGKPGPRVEHWITGMWLAHTLPLEIEPPAVPPGA